MNYICLECSIDFRVISYNRFIYVRIDVVSHTIERMRRRTLLRTVSGYLTVLVGSSTLFMVRDEWLGSELSTNFTILSKNHNGRSSDGPKITVDNEAKETIVTGTVERGNSCETVQPTKISYDDSEETLDVVIASVDSSRPVWITSCQPSLGMAKYRLVIEFPDHLPAVITATEHPTEGFDQRTATKTVR